MNIPMTLSRSLGLDRCLFLLREIPNRIATLRIASGDRLMRFAISSGDFDCAASSNTRRSCLKDQPPPFSFRAIYDFGALNCNEWNDGRLALRLGHDASLE